MTLELNNIYNMDCLLGMKEIPDNSIDLVVTDSPYGLSFMGKDWDRAVPSVDIWKECLRVLKHGAFAFIMCIPRLDCLGRTIYNLQEAGFRTDFSPIFHAFASGFPKSSNISLMVDKGECRKQLSLRLGRCPTREEFKKEWAGFREVVGRSDKGATTLHQNPEGVHDNRDLGHLREYNMGVKEFNITVPRTPEAKNLNGGYAGYQPKPAVEIIIVVMKPLTEGSYVKQALKNRHGVTWLDDARIPYIDKQDIGNPDRGKGYPMLDPKKGWNQNKIINKVTIGEKGRFPANLICSSGIDVNLESLLEARRILNEKS